MEPTQTNPIINYDDFAKLELRVATVLECKPHANADKLLVLQIDLGNGERRQICAGLRNHYEPEQLVGKQIVVVANLAPRPMRGARGRPCHSSSGRDLQGMRAPATTESGRSAPLARIRRTTSSTIASVTVKF